MSKGIYLARLGKIHGPFSETELTAFQSAGELTKYSWIWEPHQQIWRAIDPAPRPMGVSDEHAWGEGAIADNRFEALLSAGDILASADVREVTETGCEILLKNESPGLLGFRGPIYLDLLDSEKGYAQTVEAKICSEKLGSQGWALRLRWRETPEILTKNSFE
jgi:hypothetical protein